MTEEDWLNVLDDGPLADRTVEASGVDVDCGKDGSVAGLRVVDDLKRGELTEYHGSRRVRRYGYDRDSAKLLWSADDQ